MSDRAREVITDAIRLNLNRQAWTDRDEPAKHRSWINEFHVTAAIVATLEAAGIAVVELPQPCKDVWSESDIALFPARDCTPVRVRWSGEIISGSEWLDPEDARALAAALLAAANRAERAE